MRHLNDSGEAFRVRVTARWRPDFPEFVHFVGPYATASVAKAQVSRLRRDYRRAASFEAVIERSATVWTEVAE